MGSIRSRILSLTFFLWVAVACWAPGSAAAAKIPFLFTYGDSIATLGQVPPELKDALKASTGHDVQIGYAYSYFGLFWLDLWSWGGKYCLYQDRSYWELKPEQAAALLQVPENKLPKPLSYRFPPLLALIVLGVLFFLAVGMFVKTDEEKSAVLLKDERYKQALEIFRKHFAEAKAGLLAALKAPAAPTREAAENQPASTPADPAQPAIAQSEPAAPSEATFAAAKQAMSAQIQAGIDAGVEHLLKSGVNREEATQNMAILVKVESTKDSAAENAPAETPT